MSLTPWPLKSAPEPAGPVFRVEFSEKTRAELKNLRGERWLIGGGLGLWTVAVAFLLLTGKVENLGAAAIYLVPLIAGCVRIRQLSRMSSEAAAVTVSSRGVDLWSPRGVPLRLPWDAVASVRAGKLGVGLTLRDGVTARTPGVQGLGNAAGKRFAVALADPGDSPLLADQISYDRSAFVEALRRLAPKGVRITGT